MSYELGTSVEFSHQLVRVWEDDAARWEPVVFEKRGIIVGKRTLSSGKKERVDEGYDSWLRTAAKPEYEYFPTAHYQAYLVAFGLRYKPVYVLPEHMREETM